MPIHRLVDEGVHPTRPPSSPKHRSRRGRSAGRLSDWRTIAGTLPSHTTLALQLYLQGAHPPSLRNRRGVRAGTTHRCSTIGAMTNGRFGSEATTTTFSPKSPLLVVGELVREQFYRSLSTPHHNYNSVWVLLMSWLLTTTFPLTLMEESSNPVVFTVSRTVERFLLTFSTTPGEREFI